MTALLILSPVLHDSTLGNAKQGWQHPPQPKLETAGRPPVLPSGNWMESHHQWLVGKSPISGKCSSIFHIYVELSGGRPHSTNINQAIHSPSFLHLAMVTICHQKAVGFSQPALYFDAIWADSPWKWKMGSLLIVMPVGFHKSWCDRSCDVATSLTATSNTLPNTGCLNGQALGFGLWCLHFTHVASLRVALPNWWEI